MGIFEHFPYLNFHDINLDWLLKQTKQNAKDNAFLMSIFHYFEDQGLVGTVTDITENADNTVKIDYVTLPDGTPDDFTVYNKTGADNAISGAQSAAEGYADTAIANAFKGLGDLPAETDLLDTDLLLINRSGTAEAIAGDVVAKQSDMDTAENNITTLQTAVSGKVTKADINSGNSLRDFIASSSNPTGAYIVNIQQATDNPAGTGNVCAAIFLKHTSTAYAEIIAVSGSKMWISTNMAVGTLPASITWRQMATVNDIAIKPNSFVIASGQGEKTIKLDGAYKSFIVFGIISSTPICSMIRNTGGTSLAGSNIIGTAPTFTYSGTTNEFKYTAPSGTNITLIGDGLIVE